MWKYLASYDKSLRTRVHTKRPKPRRCWCRVPCLSEHTVFSASSNYPDFEGHLRMTSNALAILQIEETSHSCVNPTAEKPTKVITSISALRSIFCPCFDENLIEKCRKRIWALATNSYLILQWIKQLDIGTVWLVVVHEAVVSHTHWSKTCFQMPSEYVICALITTLKKWSKVCTYVCCNSLELTEQAFDIWIAEALTFIGRSPFAWRTI